MKIKLLEDYNCKYNDHNYKMDEIIEVEKLLGFNFAYARYFNNGEIETIDWIPVDICEVISK